MRTKTVPFLITAIMIAGCATVVVPLEPQLVGERLAFIRDGKTSKEEVLSRLGEPDSRYQGEQILTYVMCEHISLDGGVRLSHTRTTDKKSGAGPCSPAETNNLILVFGPDDLVARHSMVLFNLVTRGSVELWR